MSVPQSAGFQDRLRAVCAQPIPLPGSGETAVRHLQLFRIAEEDVSLAKLAEAHFDAVAILAEAGRAPVPGAVYAVWASELPGRSMQLLSSATGALQLSGVKPFGSGGLLVDRALVTVRGPEEQLVDVDLRSNAGCIEFDLERWQPQAFRLTQTGSATFRECAVEQAGLVGGAGWYLSRTGFWMGACGPAACWAGGVAGLLPYARASARDDAHTVAHRAAMESNVWAMRALLAEAGREIDAAPADQAAAHRNALRLRHLVEQLATDTLRRFARAYGPHPLALDAAMSRRYAEVDIFLRQSHGERDLEALGRAMQVTAT